MSPDRGCDDKNIISISAEEFRRKAIFTSDSFEEGRFLLAQARPSRPPCRWSSPKASAAAAASRGLRVASPFSVRNFEYVTASSITFSACIYESTRERDSSE